MALQAAYKQFLAAPNSSALAENASLHYVTTTSSFTGATDIIKHLASVRNKIKKKREDVLFAVEGQQALALELDTTLEFVLSGGPYLPGLDDNFLADRTVYLAVNHIVTFDGQGKIASIRQSWDQGALLKQIEVIGKSGQNWPIRDAKEQISLIAKCVKGDGVGVASPQSLPTRSRGSTNAMRDPHASLDLFASHDELEDMAAAVVSPYAGRRPRQRSFTEILGDEPVADSSNDRDRSQSPSKMVAPYAGSRPRQRSFTEILGDEPLDQPGSPSAGRERSQSPSKVVAPKIGAGKNFQPMRLFDVDEKDAAADAQERKQPSERVVRPDPKKFQHFDFDDGSEAQPAPAANPAPEKKSKRDSTWSFDDFSTPAKPVAGRGMNRARDTRHWGTENDVLEDTPAQKAPVIKPRRDAEAHFELVDDGPVREEPLHASRPPRGAQHNEGLHLYDNRLHVEEGTVPSPGPPPLGNITNLNHRHKDFDPHFNMTDDSPHHDAPSQPAKISEDRQKAVRMMQSNWKAYDESPVSRKENDNPNNAKKAAGGDDRGIAIAGDGMGGRKGTARGWLTGEGDEEPAPVKKGGRGPPTKSDNFWDF